MTTLVAATAISILAGRIKHEPVPWSETAWPSPVPMVLILAFAYLLIFRWIPRARLLNSSRKRQLETLLR